MLTTSLIAKLLSLTLINLTFSQDLLNGTLNNDFETGRAIKCKTDDGMVQRCMPVFENIAFGRDIIASNTCGQNGPQQYCVQTGTSGAVKICETCNAYADDRQSDQRHPAHLMTDLYDDENPSWWQSETIKDHKGPVYLTLNLDKKYNVAFIRLRFHSVRPHSFAIYKKSTYDPNEEWLPYQFYSRTCEETYGVPNQQSVSYFNQKIALCTDEASGMIPLSGGNVAFLTLEHRPGKNDFDDNPALQDWVTVTALRFELDRVNTFGDEVFGDPKVLRSYYFAISDITVGGRCKCNGHGSSCNNNNNEGTFQCVCEHNTAGKDCEKCLPLFNDRPWMKASGRSANPCRACNCNGLADECVFDAQLWVDSRYKSGGRCVNCKYNTDGINCEHCKEYHFRSNKKEACKPCGCNPLGSRSLSCTTKGECACHPGVTGKKCDKCKEGYYGFSSSGCRACNCDRDGSIGINCDATGQCKCKANTVGKRCDQCAPQTFDLDSSNPRGCKECFCYGHGVSCSHLEGVGIKEIYTTFEADFDGWKLQDESGADFSSNMKWDFRGQFISVNPERNKPLYLVAPQRYLGKKLSSYGKVFSFAYGSFLDPNDPPITPGKDIIFEGNGMQAVYPINAQNNNLPEARFYQFKYRLMEPAGMSTFDFQKILSNLTAIKIRTTYMNGRTGAIDNIRLFSTKFISLNSPEQVTWQEKCECKEGYAGTNCEKCDSGYTRSGGDTSPFGTCKKCFCNNHGNFCDPDTGKCQCLHNTTGDSCDQCRPSFYGNPTAGTPEDCKPCPCLYGNECILIGNSVKCTDCPEGHIGDLCELCDDGYFGDPNGTIGEPSRCQKCDCNGNIDPNAIANCDSLTGSCLKCVYNTKNGPENKCELCADGFFGNATIDPKGNCSACNCYEKGTIKPPFHDPKLPLPCDNNGKCDCLQNVIGDKCDMCPPGHWNVASGNGCELCNCNLTGSKSSDCNLSTGQCECQEGVGGRKCDQCAPGFYGFSKDGCTACNCHPDGSKHQNCTQDGVCECLPGVLGIKCDQCPENKYNLSVGCIACPRCFDLIQVAVTKLRKKLTTFNITGNLTAGNVGVDIKDEAFEERLRELQKNVSKLEQTTKDLLAGHIAIQEFYEELVNQSSNLIEMVPGIQKMIKKSKGAAETGSERIQIAEDVIEEILKLLEQAEKMLEDEKKKTFSNVTSSSNDVSGLSKRMSEIAKEARKLADQQEKESENIKSNTDMAYNNSEVAYGMAKDARDLEEAISDLLDKFASDHDEAVALLKNSTEIIEKANSTARSALNDSDHLIRKAKEALPDLDTDAMREKANDVTTEANATESGATNLHEDSKKNITQLQNDDKEARELMAKGRKLQNESNILFNVAKNASDKAKEAQEDGLKVAKDAQDMLTTLLGFESNIAKSKANATEALKLIELIRRLISEANQTTANASTNAIMANINATTALTLALAANKTTQDAMNEIENSRKEVEKLLNETMDFMMNEVAQTKDDIDDIEKSLDQSEKQAEQNSMKLGAALNDSQEATEKASMVQNELLKSLDQIENLMNEISSLDEIDFKTLEDAEKRFGEAKDTIENKLQNEIEVMQLKLNNQKKVIQEHELNLKPLEEQIMKNEKLFNYIPKSCFREKAKPEDIDK